MKNQLERHQKCALKMVAISLATLSISACSTLSDKFVSKKEADIGAFADYTIAMLNNTDIGFSGDEAVYTRRFFSPPSETEQKLVKSLQNSEVIIDGIIAYSLNLIFITETYSLESERVAAYAKYLSESDENFLKRVDLQPDHFEGSIKKIRQAETFLDALERAQPIVNAIGRHVEQLLQKSSDDTDALALVIDKRIDEHYLSLIEYRNAIKKEKYQILDDLSKVYLGYRGDNTAYKRLVTSSYSAKLGLVSSKRSMKGNLDEIARHLEKKLKILNTIDVETSSDWADYRDTHLELDRLHRETILRINRARLLALLWMRAHQRMSTGIVDPADWFDLNKTTAELFKVGTGNLF